MSRNPAHRIVCQSYWVPRDHADAMTLRNLQTWKYSGPFQGGSAAIVWVRFPKDHVLVSSLWCKTFRIRN